jgi:hypothetical protein
MALLLLILVGTMGSIEFIHLLGVTICWGMMLGVLYNIPQATSKVMLYYRGRWEAAKRNRDATKFNLLIVIISINVIPGFVMQELHTLRRFVLEGERVEMSWSICV